MRYDRILLDADGTLLNFLRSEDEAVREAMLQNGIRPTDTVVRRYSEINDGLWKRLERGEIEKSVLLYHRFELLAEEYGYTLDPHKMAEDYMQRLSEKGYLLEGAREFLMRLHGRVAMDIVTNGVGFIQRGRYARSGIESLIDRVFISDEVGYEKPNVKFFEAVAAATPDFDLRRTLMIGDSLTSDMRGGLNFGLDTCWYNPLGKERPEDMELTFVASNYDEIYNFIVSEKA